MKASCQEVHEMRVQATVRSGLGAIGLAVLLLLAACGRSSTPSTGGGSPSGTTLAVHADSVSGIGTVLANGADLTMYHNTQETGSKIVCTGSCTSVWPPVLVTGSLPQDTSMIKGTFGTIMRPDGSTQLTINGFPLYTYSGDSASGQANGQGIQGVWFAVTASGTSSSGSGGGGGRYGGGSSGSSGGGSGGYGS
jgi:predicted lipoprotein with Yx(FWY)xxD motif